MSYQKILLLLLIELVSVLVTRSSSVVPTNTGPVQGKIAESGKVEVFLGIPYAEPPVGPLRFSKPVSKTPWREIYDATRLPPTCIQVSLDIIYAPISPNISEDCLYLNLWVPRSNSTDKPKTIMVFIHGGGFVVGTTSMPIYDGTKLAEYGDVIVVTMNYRVGTLGFFTDFTDDAPGSVGLYDQVMAIKWVKENAKYFNGDPENIVLFGESAGSWSVTFHQISPLSKNLFRRAILQSGSSVSPIYDDNNAELKKISLDVINFLGCNNDKTTLANGSKDVLRCLRKAPAEKFLEADMEVYLKKSKYPILRVGNDFLPENTIDAFRKGHFKNSEVLMGITKDEGSLLLIGGRPDLFGHFGDKVVASMFNETTVYYLIQTMIQNGDIAAINKIIRGYIDDVNDETKYTYLKATYEAIGDYMITCGNIFQAEYQSLKGNPVFFYMFDHRPASTPLAEWMGVAHYDEVQFVFGNPMYKYFTKYEEELSRDIMNMWVTFAKTGNPNTIGWLKYTYKEPNYFIIGKHNTVGIRPDHYRCDRWRNLYRSVIEEDSLKA